MLYNIGNVSWKGFMDIKEIKSLRKKAKKIHNNIRQRPIGIRCKNGKTSRRRQNGFRREQRYKCLV